MKADDNIFVCFLRAERNNNLQICTLLLRKKIQLCQEFMMLIF